MSYEIKLGASTNHLSQLNSQIRQGVEGTCYKVLNNGTNVLNIVKENGSKLLEFNIQQQHPEVNTYIYNILKNNDFNISKININGVTVNLQGEAPTLQIKSLQQSQQVLETIQFLALAPFNMHIDTIDMEDNIADNRAFTLFIRQLPDTININFQLKNNSFILSKENGEISSIHVDGIKVDRYGVLTGLRTAKPSIDLVTLEQKEREKALEVMPLLTKAPFSMSVDTINIKGAVSFDQIAAFLRDLPNGKTINFSFDGKTLTIEKNNGLSISIPGKVNLTHLSTLLQSLASIDIGINSLKSDSIDFKKNGLQRIFTYKDATSLSSNDFQSLKNLPFFTDAGSKAIFQIPVFSDFKRFLSCLREGEEIHRPSNANNDFNSYFCIKLDDTYISLEPNNNSFRQDYKKTLETKLTMAGFKFRPTATQSQRSGTQSQGNYFNSQYRSRSETHRQAPPTAGSADYARLGEVFTKLNGFLKSDTDFNEVFSHRDAKTTIENLLKEYEKGNEANFREYVKANKVKILICSHPDKNSLTEIDENYKDMFTILNTIINN